MGTKGAVRNDGACFRPGQRFLRWPAGVAMNGIRRAGGGTADPATAGYPTSGSTPRSRAASQVRAGAHTLLAVGHGCCKWQVMAGHDMPPCVKKGWPTPFDAGQEGWRAAPNTPTRRMSNSHTVSACISLRLCGLGRNVLVIFSQVGAKLYRQGASCRSCTFDDFNQSDEFLPMTRGRFGKRPPFVAARVIRPEFLASGWCRGNVSVSRRGTVTMGETPPGDSHRTRRKP